MSKKFPHPSSDIIAVLAGLDSIDTIFTDFVGTLDGIIRNGKTCKANPRRRGMMRYDNEEGHWDADG